MSRTLNREYFLDVAMGNIPGQSAFYKWGFHSDLSAGVPADIWEYGTTEAKYTFSTGVDIDTISSSDATDTQDVYIIGLGAGYVEVHQTVTLAGQAKVVLGTPLLRVDSMYNDGATNIAGDVYLYEDTPIVLGVPTDTTKVRSYMNGNNNTLTSIYTVPAGKTAYFLQAIVGSGGAAADVSWKMLVRLLGGVFQNLAQVGTENTGTSALLTGGPIPGIFPEKTDIVVQATSSANNVEGFAVLDFLIVDN